ncbi:hypothetical protein BD779DRAFT_1678353 [Infundibulicybe gibba]|nr:hypothetical protein BD779DRAFT_1678353 [Infundibulicybe gibba]
MKYLAIISALLASQAMGAMAQASCPTATTLRLLGGVVTLDINVPKTCEAKAICMDETFYPPSPA